ncbi:hypothetical protein [Gordonia insulae]|uniref:hypothetical protein n=1 Tax=Gordonia insulae TaxID=2420509 RepID=UPI001E2E27C2|nr:hypothetical protein [Gordonia insulae]
MRTGCAAIAFLAVAAVGSVLAAPAGAEVRGVAVDTPAGYGSTSGSTNYDVYGTGCAYQLDIIVDGFAASKSNLVVTSTANGKKVTLLNKKPTASLVKATWRPTTPGAHVLSATLDGVTKTRTVKVASGVQLPWFIRGGPCFVLPY